MINHEHKFIFVHIGKTKTKANTNTILNTTMTKLVKLLRKNTQRTLKHLGISLGNKNANITQT